MIHPPARRPRLRRVLAIGMGALLVAAAGAAAPAPASTSACKGGNIVIGLDKAQTGFFALNDQADANGVKLAIAIANQHGGVLGCTIKTISGDAKSDPAVGG